MKAVLHVGPRHLEIIELPDPVAGAGQAVVAMRAAGICGSDLHRYRSKPYNPPLSNIPGHEPCGVVESVGEGVTHLRAGQRVTVYHYEGCGHCAPCHGGDWMWCGERRATGWHIEGSCADKLLISARNCLPLPDELSFEEGALIACGAGTTWSSLRKLRPESGETALVFGLGPIGLIGVAMLRAFGARVVAVGRRASRLRLAQEMGAESVIDIDSETDVPAAIRRVFPDGARLAFETSAAPAAQQQMIKSLGHYGRAVVVGIGNREPAFNLGALTANQLTVSGSYVMNIGEYQNLTRFLLDNPLHLGRIVTHRFSIEDAAAAFETADCGDAAKVLFEWINA